MATLFNDLLIEAGISPSNVRLLRHHTTAGLNGQSLHDLWLRDRAGFELYQKTQIPRWQLFRTGRVWAAFTSPAKGRTVFAGLYDARYVETAAVDWKCPYRGDAPGRGGPVDVFETGLRPELSDLIGQLEVEWDGASFRSWARYASDLALPLVGSAATSRTSAREVGGGLAVALATAGFAEKHRTKKVVGYGRAGLSVYLKADTERFPLVLHPRYFDLADQLAAIPGISFERPLKPYINSNMRSLAAYDAIHRSTSSRYGFAISASPASIPALVELLIEGRTMEIAGGEIRLVGDDDAPLTETERLAAARVGQGEFRSSLMGLWKGTCPVLGVDHPRLLRASHIKPWRSASGRERLDPYNGLLLATQVDALFDAGLISFQDNGRMLVSWALSKRNLERMGVSEDSAIRGLTDQHASYLQYHRSNVFLG